MKATIASPRRLPLSKLAEPKIDSGAIGPTQPERESVSANQETERRGDHRITEGQTWPLQPEGDTEQAQGDDDRRPSKDYGLPRHRGNGGWYHRMDERIVPPVPDVPGLEETRT
jgi:hypothetical protein